MKDVFGFAEYQEIATYGLGYKLPLERISGNHVLTHRAGTEAANLALGGRNIIENFSWLVLPYTPNTPNTPNTQQQKFLYPQTKEHIVSRAAKEITYNKRSSYTKM